MPDKTANSQTDSTAQFDGDMERLKKKISWMRDVKEKPQPNPPLTVKIAVALNALGAVLMVALAMFTVSEGFGGFVGWGIGWFSHSFDLLTLERRAWKNCVFGLVATTVLLPGVGIAMYWGLLPVLPARAGLPLLGLIPSYIALALLLTPSSRRAFKEWEEIQKRPSTSPNAT